MTPSDISADPRMTSPAAAGIVNSPRLQKGPTAMSLQSESAARFANIGYLIEPKASPLSVRPRMQRASAAVPSTGC
jgi:hypothetical protein